MPAIVYPRWRKGLITPPSGPPPLTREEREDNVRIAWGVIMVDVERQDSSKVMKMLLDLHGPEER